MASNNPFYVEPANPLQALMMGVQGFDKGREIYQQNQMEAGRKSALEALMAGDANQAIAHLIGSGDTKSATALAQYQQNANSVYGTPIYGTTPDGKPAIGTFDKRGQFKQVNTGGFTVTPGIKTVDTPQGTYVIGSKDGQPISTTMPATAPGQTPAPGGATGQVPGQSAPGFYRKDYQNTEAEKRLGQETGEKQAAMGKAQGALNSSLGALDRMANTATDLHDHPGLSGNLGIMGLFPNIPGGNAANANAQFTKLKSQISFGVLQAMREASKTGGALGNVSDQEGVRLENNLAALDRAQDVPSFKKAMKDIIEYVNSSKANLQQVFYTDYGGLKRQDTNAQPAARTGQPNRVTKTIGGKTYYQDGGKWYEE